ncbi:MAG: PocR ligand-binding domain-containing protein, partial [Nanoarchaeota archaeon]
MEFKETVDMPTWQRIQDAAAAALGMPVFCADAVGRPLVASGAMPAYAVMLENKSAVIATTRQKELRERPEPHTYCCASGLHYAIAPVHVNGNMLCAVVAGPLKLTQDLDAPTIQLAKLTGIDTNELLAALAAIPLSGNEALASAHALVKALAKILPEAAIYRKEAAAQIHSLRTLLDFSNQLGTQLELEPLFSTTIQFCVKQFGLQDASIWYADSVMRFSAEEDRNALCA